MKLAAVAQRRWPPLKVIVTSGYVQFLKADLPACGRFSSKPYGGVAVAAALRENEPQTT
jgi:hypothetical protein